MSSLKTKAKIAILKSPLKGYDDVYPHTRPWTKHLRRNLAIDESVMLYIKSKYPNVEIKQVTLDAILKNNDYDLVWAGTEMYANAGWIVAHRPKQSKTIFKKLKKVKNMVPSFEYIQFMGDKCNYTQKIKAPFTPTHCISPKNKESILELQKKYKGEVFVKPAFGSESIDLYHDTSKNLGKYVDRIANEKVHDTLVVQPKRVFCTECNPEIKAYFVGKKFSYAIGMKWGGKTIGFYETLPRKAHNVALKAIKELEKYEKTIVSRVDMYKFNNEYIINEIEISPAIASEDIANIKNWKYDSHIGDRLISFIN